MHKLINYYIFALIVVLLVAESSQEGCMCNVRFVGQYCGIELNEKSGGGNCTRDMYFCGKGNLNKEAVILKTCKKQGFECDASLNGGIDGTITKQMAFINN